MTPIVRLLIEGAQDREIADRLHLGLRTVERRISCTMTRYGLRNRFQLGALALHLGWLAGDDVAGAITPPAPSRRG
ncbi:LuxR C-terminal-related transcriptional regulator [Catellatospora sp. NPDC049609]|uniref:response regulator transcription factor n=1 Tax=Catellatospora sp. NPDC049609 TaxID=3155505 RepID=UPI003421AC0E